MMVGDLALVAGGSAVGGVARYVLAAQVDARLLACWPGFPWGTFLVNALGCLAIGLLAPWSDTPGVRLGLMVGVLGGFTTFSAFGLQTWTLVQQGAALQALSYAAASLLVCLGAVALGMLLGRTLHG